MLRGTLIRGFKCYKDVSYIPCSNGENFSLIVGNNGVGKSAIMEGLDFFFNNTEWNYHKETKKDTCFVCGIFALTQERLNSIGIEQAERDVIDAYLQKIRAMEVVESDNARWPYKGAYDLIKSEKEGFLIPITRLSDENIYRLHSLGFNSQFGEGIIEGFLRKVIESYRYIYIPVELNIGDYLKIEGTAFQSIGNEDLEARIAQLLSKNHDGDQSILSRINSELSNYLEEIRSIINAESDGYDISSEWKKKDNVYAKHLTNDIINGFFGKKALKKDGKSIDKLSSGERRLVLVDILNALIQKNLKDAESSIRTTEESGVNKRDLTPYYIISIDEPEASLHVSKIFSQFRKVKKLACEHVQVLAISHWYGAIPVLNDGTLINLSSEKDGTRIYDLRTFFADNTNERAGFRTKSFFDFASSIFLSLQDPSSKYLIVEGVEDVNYLESHFPDIQIIPTGGISKSAKIYELLVSMYDKDESDISGKIFILIDTDVNQCSLDKFVEPPKTKKDIDKRIRVRRIQIDLVKKQITLLEPWNKTVVSPPTAIEDAVDSEILRNAVSNLFPNETKNFISNPNPWNSSLVNKGGIFIHKGTLETKEEEEEVLEQLLKSQLGKRNKEMLSKEYKKLLNGDCCVRPWKQEILNYLNEQTAATICNPPSTESPTSSGATTESPAPCSTLSKSPGSSS